MAVAHNQGHSRFSLPSNYTISFRNRPLHAAFYFFCLDIGGAFFGAGNMFSNAAIIRHYEEPQNQDGSAIATALDGIDGSSFQTQGQRTQALLSAYALVARLETPWETVIRLSMGQPAMGAALKVIKDLKLLDKWHEAGDKPASAHELAAMVSCEPALLERLLRHLAAYKMLGEPSAGVFEPTRPTMALRQPVFGEWIEFLYDVTIPCYSKLPEYLAQTGYKTPFDPAGGVFQYAKGWDGDAFQYFQAHPRQGESFNHAIGGVTAQQAGWTDIFPHERLLETAKDDGSPLVVDVGGNIGHDMERFRQAHPQTAHRLYLEDKPEVVKVARCPDPVHKIAYDFFTLQPVKGARAYYMHAVLHDWPDHLARKILSMQKDALTPGYSTLLIHDHVLPKSQAHPLATGYDITMMVMLAGMERTEDHWRDLLESEGYRISRIWTSPPGQSIIEAELA